LCFYRITIKINLSLRFSSYADGNDRKVLASDLTSDFRLLVSDLCPPRATLPAAAGHRLSNGAHRGRRSSNSGWIFVPLPEPNYPRSYSSNDPADCDAPGPTSSRPMESGPAAHEGTAVWAQARARPLQRLFGSLEFSKLRSPQVRPRGFDQIDHGMTVTSQARSGPPPGKARRTNAYNLVCRWSVSGSTRDYNSKLAALEGTTDRTTIQ